MKILNAYLQNKVGEGLLVQPTETWLSSENSNISRKGTAVEINGPTTRMCDRKDMHATALQETFHMTIDTAFDQQATVLR